MTAHAEKKLNERKTNGKPNQSNRQKLTKLLRISYLESTNEG